MKNRHPAPPVYVLRDGQQCWSMCARRFIPTRFTWTRILAFLNAMLATQRPVGRDVRTLFAIAIERGWGGDFSDYLGSHPLIWQAPRRFERQVAAPQPRGPAQSRFAFWTEVKGNNPNQPSRGPQHHLSRRMNCRSK